MLPHLQRSILKKTRRLKPFVISTCIQICPVFAPLQPSETANKICWTSSGIQTVIGSAFYNFMFCVIKQVRLLRVIAYKVSN